MSWKTFIARIIYAISTTIVVGYAAVMVFGLSVTGWCSSLCLFVFYAALYYSSTRKGIPGTLHVGYNFMLMPLLWIPGFILSGVIKSTRSEPVSLLVSCIPIVIVMISCYAITAFRYIKYIISGKWNKPKKKENACFSNSGFLCIRDMVLLILIPFWFIMYNRKVLYIIDPQIELCFLILIILWIIGNIVNGILFFIACKKYGTWGLANWGNKEVALKDERVFADKPVLLSLDILDWEPSFTIAVMHRDAPFVDAIVLVPEFAIDKLMHRSHPCYFSWDDAMYKNQFETVNAFSYADACRQLLKQERGKNGIFFFTKRYYQVMILKAILSQEEFEKITVVSAYYKYPYSYAD